MRKTMFSLEQLPVKDGLMMLARSSPLCRLEVCGGCVGWRRKGRTRAGAVLGQEEARHFGGWAQVRAAESPAVCDVPDGHRQPCHSSSQCRALSLTV